MKKFVKPIVLMISLLSLCGITTASAYSNSGISGGWSETGGYYINGTVGIDELSESNLAVSAGTPTETPNSHVGRRLTITDNAGDSKYAAHGETVWYYKYHYTTARMELSNGTVKTTSGRVWDYNATVAESPYYMPGIFENTEARTYWGCL